MKIKFFFLLAAMLQSVCAFAQSENNVSLMKADVNDDGVVDVADITAVISIMKKGGGVAVPGYFYLGTTKPTADNYQSLQGVTVSYISIDEAIGTTVSVSTGATLYMLCPAAWMKEKNVALQDNSENQYDFLEEKDDATISGYVIYKTQAFSSSTDVTLKTKEDPIISFTISWDGNGGTGHTGGSTSVNEGETITLPATNPTRDGYTFKGWATTNTAELSDVNEETIPTGNVTYYAVWEAIPVTYYWYVGTTPITSSSTPGSGTIQTSEREVGWHLISGTPAEIQVGPTARQSSNVTWYIAIPNTLGITKATSGGLTDISVTSSIMTLSDGVVYRVFVTTEAQKINYLMTK